MLIFAHWPVLKTFKHFPVQHRCPLEATFLTSSLESCWETHVFCYLFALWYRSRPVSVGSGLRFWWCLWREEALAERLPRVPLGRPWLWPRRVIWLDLRLCPLSRTWETSCGKSCGVQQLTLSHHTPSFSFTFMNRWVSGWPLWHTCFLHLLYRKIQQLW